LHGVDASLVQLASALHLVRYAARGAALTAEE
jgi:hypothetical protein